MKLASFILLSLCVSGCNLPFDTAPNTPAQARKASQSSLDAQDVRPAPSSPFMGRQFFFDGSLPDGWYVSSRGDDGSLAPGYAALCVVSQRSGNDKVLFLLAASVDAAERAEVARHMQDADWWQPRIPRSFFDFDSVNPNEVGLSITKGLFSNAGSLMLFVALRCGKGSCDSSLVTSREIASRLQLRSARADDERVVSPTAVDCGSRF
jgi:hypothetical protein